MLRGRQGPAPEMMEVTRGLRIFYGHCLSPRFLPVPKAICDRYSAITDCKERGQARTAGPEPRPCHPEEV